MSYASEVAAIQARYEKELAEFAKESAKHFITFPSFPVKPIPQLIKQINDLQFCFDEILGELGWGDEIAETGVDPLSWARNEIKNSKIETTKLRARLGTARAQLEAKVKDISQSFYCAGEGFHAVIEEENKELAVEKFVRLMNEKLEPEKGISIKNVTCEPVNTYRI